MSKTIEEIESKRLLKDYIDTKNNQIKEIQEQNAELVDLVERCRDVIYAYNDSIPTETGNEILQAIQDRLTKYNRLNKK